MENVRENSEGNSNALEEVYGNAKYYMLRNSGATDVWSAYMRRIAHH